MILLVGSHTYFNKIKILQRRIKRRDYKIKSFKGPLAITKKNVPGSDKFAYKYEKQSSGFSLNLRVRDQKSKLLGKNGVRYRYYERLLKKGLIFIHLRVILISKSFLRYLHPLASSCF